MLTDRPDGRRNGISPQRCSSCFLLVFEGGQSNPRRGGDRGKNGVVRNIVLDASDLKASDIDADVPPYGTFDIPGGFPLGEFVRVGIVIIGIDATGVPMTYYSLIEF